MLFRSDPGWVSDYTFEEFYDRIVTVNGMARQVVDAQPAWYQTAIVGADGSLRRGSSHVELMLPPEGPKRAVELLDADGAVVDVVDATFMAFDHLPGGVLVVPEAPTSVTSVRLDGEAALWQ